MSSSSASENLRRNLRAALEYRDMTFADIARQQDLAKPALSRFMTGKEDATLGRAEKIAEAVRIPLGVLLGAPGEFREWIRSRMLSVGN